MNILVLILNLLKSSSQFLQNVLVQNRTFLIQILKSLHKIHLTYSDVYKEVCNMETTTL